MSRRRNGEGSIYSVPGGYRGYAWCTRPDGTRYRKYVQGKTYEATRRAWFRLRDEAGLGPVSSDVPKLSDFLSYWLKEIVQPNACFTRCGAGSPWLLHCWAAFRFPQRILLR